MRLATQSDLTTGTIYSLIMSTYLSSLLNDYRSTATPNFISILFSFLTFF